MHALTGFNSKWSKIVQNFPIQSHFRESLVDLSLFEYKAKKSNQKGPEKEYISQINKHDNYFFSKLITWNKYNPFKALGTWVCCASLRNPGLKYNHFKLYHQNHILVIDCFLCNSLSSVSIQLTFCWYTNGTNGS